MFGKNLKILLILFLPLSLSAGKSLDSLIVFAKKLPPEKRLEFCISKTWKLRARSPHTALKLGKIALSLAKEKEDYSDAAKVLNFIGVIYRNIGNHDSSFAYYTKALNYAQLADDSVQIAYAFNNIGGYYGYTHKYFLALENVFRARDIFTKLKNERGIAYCNIQAGLWYAALYDYDRAIKYLREAIQIRQKLGDKFGIAVAKSLIANNYYLQGKFDEALSLTRELLEIFKKFDDQKGIGVSLGTLGGIYFHRGNYKQALAYRLESLKYLRKVYYPSGMINSLNGIGIAYHQLGDDQKAIESLKESIKLARQYHYEKGLITAYLLLARIAQSSNNPKLLHYYHDKALQVQDSIRALDRKSRIEEFEKILNINRINEKNLRLEHELATNKVIVHSAIIFGVIIIVFLIILYYKNKDLRLEKRLLHEAIETKNKLFGIIAHDLRGPFTSLLGYSELTLDDFDSFTKEEIKDIMKHMHASLKNLLAMIENLLYWARSQSQEISYEPEIFDLNKELKRIINYYSSSANSKNIEIKTEFYDEPNVFSDLSLFHTITRNILNNAIKFTPEGGEIRITTEPYGEDGKILIAISDNGIGMSKEQIDKIMNMEADSTPGTQGEKGTGLGMKLVVEMVHKNQGELFIKSEPGKGTEISFTVPLSK